jgi:hypothetical protein
MRQCTAGHREVPFEVLAGSVVSPAAAQKGSRTRAAAARTRRETQCAGHCCVWQCTAGTLDMLLEVLTGSVISPAEFEAVQ